MWTKVVVALLGAGLILFMLDVALWWAFTPFWFKIRDWLTYRSPTDEQIAELVARSVANARYESWHKPEEHAGPPPVSHLRHGFTELTEAEKARKETP